MNNAAGVVVVIVTAAIELVTLYAVVPTMASASTGSLRGLPVGGFNPAAYAKLRAAG